MFKNILLIVFLLISAPTYAVLPNIFATQPAGNVAASKLDTNFTFLESQGVQAITTTGSADAYVATPADAWVTSYSSYIGRALTIIPNFTNSGASTTNVSTLGAASIYKNIAGSATALAAGDIVSGSPAILICDGTNFLLANPTPASAAGGGAMVLLDTQTISSPTASVSDTTHITNTYSHYVWECSNLKSSTNNVDAFITIQQGGVFQSSNYQWGSLAITSGNSSNHTSSISYGGTNFDITAFPSLAAEISSTIPSTIRFEFWNPATAANLNVIYNGTFTDGATTSTFVTGSGIFNNAAATTGIKLVMSAGSVSTALCKIYGIQ